MNILENFDIADKKKEKKRRNQQYKHLSLNLNYLNFKINDRSSVRTVDNQFNFR